MARSFPHHNAIQVALYEPSLALCVWHEAEKDADACTHENSQSDGRERLGAVV